MSQIRQLFVSYKKEAISRYPRKSYLRHNLAVAWMCFRAVKRTWVHQKCVKRNILSGSLFQSTVINLFANFKFLSCIIFLMKWNCFLIDEFLYKWDAIKDIDKSSYLQWQNAPLKELAESLASISSLVCLCLIAMFKFLLPSVWQA